LRQIVADIWSLAEHLKVIPTNVGWRKDGANVMGRGLAKQAEGRYPGLAEWYGGACQKMTSGPRIHLYEDLILFPVKPLNEDAPWLSWRSEASLEVIEKSAQQLARLARIFHLAGEIAVPLVGCGNGRLKEEDVLPILERYLNDNRFILVRAG